MDSLLVTIANISETMLWVVGPLFLAVLAALIILNVRSGTVNQEEEGRVLDEQGPLSYEDRNAMGVEVTFGGTGQTKKSVLVSRSSFITDESLVDGTATKSQRLTVLGIKLAFLFLWLLIVFGILSALLPSNPVVVLFMVTIMSVIFFLAARLVRKGRADALRKLKGEVAPGKDGQKE